MNGLLEQYAYTKVAIKKGWIQLISSSMKANDVWIKIAIKEVDSQTLRQLRIIDWLYTFYTVSIIFQPYNGGHVKKLLETDARRRIINQRKSHPRDQDS